MKKILITISIIAALCMSADAQGFTDGFFTSNYDNYENVNREVQAMSDIMPLFPERIGENGTPWNQDADDPNAAPLGAGVLLLAGMGVAYAMKKRNEE